MNKEEEIARAAANEYLDRFRIFVNSIVGEMGKDKRLYSGKLIAILRAFSLSTTKTLFKTIIRFSSEEDSRRFKEDFIRDITSD